MMAAESEFQERFWSKVEVLPSKVKVVGQADTECWEWRGGRTGRGFGSVWLPERRLERGPHRVAYELTFGEIPQEMLVLHTCGSRTCCNPSHLCLGTSKGTNNPQAVLTDAEVVEIRERWDWGERMAHLAEEYGVSKTNIGHIVSRKRWRHLL